MLVNRYRAACQRAAEPGLLQLPDPIGYCHCIVLAYHPFGLHGEHPVQASVEAGVRVLPGHDPETFIQQLRRVVSMPSAPEDQSPIIGRWLNRKPRGPFHSARRVSIHFFSRPPSTRRMRPSPTTSNTVDVVGTGNPDAGFLLRG